VALTPAIVAGATLATSLLWLALAATGLAKRLAQWIPKPALLGVVMGLGFSFMLEDIRMMARSWTIAAGLLTLTLALMARSRVPEMVQLLAGSVVAIVQQPTLVQELAAIRPALRPPAFAWPSLGWQDLWLGALLLALPQMPLTFGNALIAITEENNRLFPDRPVSERRVAYSNGIMNLGSSLLGGIPMCHGARGLAGHVKFGACTGGASVMLGGLLTVTALFFAESVGTLLRLFPPAPAKPA
jgi:predicted benzoate:H+ symporter BenE